MLRTTKLIVEGLRSLRSSLPIVAIVGGLLAYCDGAAATVYDGNGQSGFGGALGNGSLTITDDGSGNITFSLSPQNGGNLGTNAVAIYIANGNANGLSDTSTLMDNTDGGRTVVSGYSSATQNPIVTFPTGFKAAFGLSFEDTTAGAYAGLFGLPGADPNATTMKLDFITGASQTGDPIVVTIPIADLGLSEGQSFEFVGSLISTTAYRSDESIGATTATMNPGFTGADAFTSYDTFYAPEPASLGLLAIGGVGLVRPRRVKPLK